MRLALIALCASLALSAIPGDLISQLPGWSAPLPSAQYSGFVEIDEATGKFMHYWFVECETSPSTAPVLVRTHNCSKSIVTCFVH